MRRHSNFRADVAVRDVHYHPHLCGGVENSVTRKAPPLGRALIDEIVLRVLGPLADTALRDRLLRILMQTAIAGGTSTAETLGIAPTLSEGAAIIRQLLQSHTPAIVGINDTTRTQIRDALYDIVEDGGALSDQVAAVRRVFGTASRARAHTIARTESTIFWHAGGRGQAHEAGAQSHTWLATRDPRVRDSHREADGQCQAIGRAYQVGGHPLWHPGDPTAPIQEIANCRCTETFGVGACPTKSAQTYEQRTAIWKRTMRQLAAHERLAFLTMRRIFRDQRAAVLTELARVAA